MAFALGFGTAACATAQQPLPRQSADALLHRVDDHYNHLRTMRTHYIERYTGLGMTRTETGTLLLSKPGRMRWQYDKPAGKLFLFDGRYAWFYTPGDPQVQRILARQMDDLRTPLRFLLGHTQLARELQDVAVTEDGPLLRIAGVPRGTHRIRQIVLEVTPLGEIAGMSVMEPDGAETSFHFRGTEENVAATDSDFRFTPPAGVTVVNGAPPL